MSINPQKLEKWDSRKDESMTKVFEQTFSIFEKLEASLSGSGAPMGRSAHYDARQTLACIAKILDGNFTRRAMIQTEDDEQGMIVDVLSCEGALIRKRDDKKGAPLILARVSYHRKSDDPAKTKQIVDAVAKTMHKSGSGVQSIKAGCAEEMELLLKYFKKNKELLSKDFLQKFEKNLPKRFSIIPGSFTTFISPLLTGEMEKVCNMCGKPSSSVCSRCKLVRYCSKECQKEDWKKGHKEDCVSKQDCVLQARDSKSYVEIDPAKIPDDIVYGATISHHQSMALQPREPVDLRTMIKKQPVGKMEVLKVQVQLYSKVTDSGVIYVYSKGKKFEMDMKAEMFTDGFEGYKCLFEFVKEKGDDAGYGCGGVKLFAHGFVTQERKLRILIDKVLPLQKW